MADVFDLAETVVLAYEKDIPSIVLVEGQPGPAGKDGANGAGAGFIHTQTTPASQWIVNHNLGRRVSATVTNLGGVSLICDIQVVDNNQVIVNHASDIAGYVVIE
jgi:hypothetical protein